MKDLRAPFPYIGTKEAVAPQIWASLGDVPVYVEPFCGSAAVLWARPFFNARRHTEILIDKNGFVCNVWRSIKHSPQETAAWCVWPVNHIDLTARCNHLVKNREDLLAKLLADPDYHDPKLAGFWIWSSCCSITCNSVPGPKVMEKPGTRPSVCDLGGILRKTITTCKSSEAIYRIVPWLRRISKRMFTCRVVCGEWDSMFGSNILEYTGTPVGVFLDPPYIHSKVDKRCYEIAFDLKSYKRMQSWCLDKGKDPNYRIILAGYKGEHDFLVKQGWRIIDWQASASYHRDETKKQNRFLERLWVSPHCEGNNSKNKLF